MSKHHATGRSQRVLQHLVAHPEGRTVRALIAQVEPDCAQSNMSGTVATLVAAGKVRAKATARPTVYVAAKDALIDRRSNPAPRAQSGRTPEHRVPRAMDPAPEPPPRGNRLMASLGGIDHAKAQASAALAGDIAAWQAKGGQIQRLPMGASSRPLTTNPLHALHEASWLQRQGLVALPD